MFDVKVVQLMEDSGQDWKYEIGVVGGYVAVGGRVCYQHQNIFNLMIYLTIFIVAIFFPYILTMLDLSCMLVLS